MTWVLVKCIGVMLGMGCHQGYHVEAEYNTREACVTKLEYYREQHYVTIGCMHMEDIDDEIQ